MKSKSVNRLFLLMAMFFVGNALWAQQKYWVFLADKGPEQAFWEMHPEEYLSPRALQRRFAVGNYPTSVDFPVSPTYTQQLSHAGVHVHGTSRWLNAVSVETTLSLKELQSICPAATGMQRVARFTTTAYDRVDTPVPTHKTEVDSIAYGNATDQVLQLNLKCLHDRGFTGDGVLLAIFDAGFFNADTIHAFDSLWMQGRVLTYYDFVNSDTTLFDEHNHGMNCLSTIVANLPGQMVGTAPHVTVAMARTETVFSETHQEEDNWMAAVEWADSLGAEVISSSLGYTLFDPGQGDFSYEDLDGNTTIISRAADMAAARGILVVNSAGNEGNAPWRHISAPCDGDSVLCVGAVDAAGNYVSFSGKGPSADGQVKPDVAAMGLGATIIGTDGSVTAGSGTSFSAPIIAGFAACLRQAHPQRSNMEIIGAIQQSAHQYLTPDTLLGYGIPDACKADSILDRLDSLATSTQPVSQGLQQVQVYPNPAKDVLVLENRFPSNPMTAWRLMTSDGREVDKADRLDAAERQQLRIALKSMSSGIYLVQITFGTGQVQVTRFVKE